MATPTSLPATFVAGNVLTAAQMNDLRGAFRILQVVRVTDNIDRSTTSTSYVDVGGLSVTITPNESDSAIIVLTRANVNVTRASGTTTRGYVQLTDNSNNPLSGADEIELVAGGSGLSDAQLNASPFIVGYDTPATTSATTYKTRFKVQSSNTIVFENAIGTAHMFAIEVSA